MTNKEMLENFLKAEGCFDGKVPKLIQQAKECISTNASDRMKIGMAVSELVTFTSHLRKAIELADGTLVPINAITIVLAASGIAKDSSVNQVRKALQPAYALIEDYRIEFATEQAKRDAMKDGKEEKFWMQYYVQPRELNSGIGTIEGTLAHMARLEQGELGSFAMTVSEIGAELQSNKNITELLIAISMGYDLGKIPAKIVKGDANQTASIHSLPMNALLFGSQENILFDEHVKSKFKVEFSTKLSRRSLFIFNTEVPITPQFDNPEKLIEYKQKIREGSAAAQDILRQHISSLVDDTTQDPLTLPEETQAIIDIYQEYNIIVADAMDKRYPIAQLARRHNHWKAMKIAGMFTIMRTENIISIKDYVNAVRVVELFSDDLRKFEQELQKEDYEMFCDFIKALATDEGKASVSAHMIKKLGYIKGSGSIAPKMAALVQMASSYDPEGLYEVQDNNVLFEKIKKTDVTGASFVAVTGNKEQRRFNCASGYTFSNVAFNNLSGLLTSDVAFSPFEFKDGIRSRDGVIGGTSWVCLDVDEGHLTDGALHTILDGVNHHIARTSNATIDTKFRVILQLDAYVDISHREWKYFVKSVGEYCGLIVDDLPKSQIFFGYAGREVLSTLDGEPITVKEHILYAKDKINQEKPDKEYTAKEKSEFINSPFTTFANAFECVTNGSRALYAAARKAYKLGMAKKEIKELMDEISEYWENPMPVHRLEAIKRQIEGF